MSDEEVCKYCHDTGDFYNYGGVQDCPYCDKVELDKRLYMWHDVYDCPDGCTSGHSFESITEYLSEEDCIEIKALEVDDIYSSDDGWTCVSRDK